MEAAVCWMPSLKLGEGASINNFHFHSDNQEPTSIAQVKTEDSWSPMQPGGAVSTYSLLDHEHVQWPTTHARSSICSVIQL